MGQDRDRDPDLAAGITPSLTRRSLLRTALASAATGEYGRRLAHCRVW